MRGKGVGHSSGRRCGLIEAPRCGFGRWLRAASSLRSSCELSWRGDDTKQQLSRRLRGHSKKDGSVHTQKKQTQKRLSINSWGFLGDTKATNLCERRDTRPSQVAREKTSNPPGRSLFPKKGRVGGVDPTASRRQQYCCYHTRSTKCSNTLKRYARDKP